MLQINTKWFKTRTIIIHCSSLFALAALAQHEKDTKLCKTNIEQLNMQCHLECSCMVAIAMLTKQKNYRLHLAKHGIWQMLIIIVQVSLGVSCHYCNNMRTTRYSLQIFVIWPMIIARFFMFVCKCSVYQHWGWHMSMYENKTSNVHWHVFIWQLTSCTRQQQDKWHHAKEKRSDKWQLSAVMTHCVSRLLNIIMDSYMLQNNVIIFESVSSLFYHCSQVPLLQHMAMTEKGYCKRRW